MLRPEPVHIFDESAILADDDVGANDVRQNAHVDAHWAAKQNVHNALGHQPDDIGRHIESREHYDPGFVAVLAPSSRFVSMFMVSSAR